MNPRKALTVFSRHPWVFPNTIERVEGDPVAGSPVEVCTQDGTFIAYGLFNPQSQLRVRLYSWDVAQPLGPDLWVRRVQQALALRKQLRPDPWQPHDAIRLINSEGDQLSGLTVDRFGDYLVAQFTSRALYEQRNILLDELTAQCQPKGILLRTEKHLRAAEGLEVQDVILSGEQPPTALEIIEHGVIYKVDLAAGQKTGFYLDQRENRLAARTYAKGARVLDLCCYTGGFALNCAGPGQAAQVLAVDSSASALELAAHNVERNGCTGLVELRKQDNFKALEELAAEQRKFELVILDPPKMARSRSGIESALRGYFSLNRLALDVLTPGGTLITCSCTGIVDRGQFFDAVVGAALQAGRSLQLIEARGPAADHVRSAHCLESDYLKCLIFRAE